MLVGQNVGLISARSNKSSKMDHFFVTRHITETKCGESTTQSCTFPLYLYEKENRARPIKGGGRAIALVMFESKEGYATPKPNISPEFIAAITAKLGLEFVPKGTGDLKSALGPEDIFHYIYAVFHSPAYRQRYAEFLKIDFPRVPLTEDRSLFKALAEKGADLVAIHLMESPSLSNLVTSFPVAGSDEVERVRYAEPCKKEKGAQAPGRVYINKTQYFEGVDPQVWEFQIGGYQVLEKWLKDRKGRKLSFDDLYHYQKIVVALKETIRIMQEIDELIPSWPIE